MPECQVTPLRIEEFLERCIKECFWQLKLAAEKRPRISSIRPPCLPSFACARARCFKLPLLTGRQNHTEDSLEFKVEWLNLEIGFCMQGKMVLKGSMFHEKGERPWTSFVSNSGGARAPGEDT